MLHLLAGVGCAALASDEPGLPDEELLEFLGSWEGESDEWQEFFDSFPSIVDLGERASGEKRDDQENGR